jgi:hypothetical protein
MKNIKIDDLTIKYKTIKTASNYDVSVQVFKGKVLQGGTIMKRGTSELEIAKFAIHLLENKAAEELF